MKTRPFAVTLASASWTRVPAVRSLGQHSRPSCSSAPVPGVLVLVFVVVLAGILGLLPVALVAGILGVLAVVLEREVLELVVERPVLEGLFVQRTLIA